MKINNLRAGKFFEAKIPTTLEMDGIIKQEDIDNRFTIMGLCVDCNKWTQAKADEKTRKLDFKCSNCGSENYDRRESRSLRTWLITKDQKKRRVTKKDNRA